MTYDRTVVLSSSSLGTCRSNCSLHVVSRSVNLLLKMYIEAFSWYYSKQGTSSRIERWLNRFASANNHEVITVESRTFVKSVAMFTDFLSSKEGTNIKPKQSETYSFAVFHYRPTPTITECLLEKIFCQYYKPFTILVGWYSSVEERIDLWPVDFPWPALDRCVTIWVLSCNQMVASRGGAVWWMFTRWKAAMVYLQGKSCVIHT